jgi:methyl-accepting chemotaxis protein
MLSAPKSLYGKLVLSVSTIIVAVVSVFAVVTYLHHSARMKETEQKTVFLMARSLSLVCADYLLAEDYAAMETYLKRYAILPNILSIEVFDAQGNGLVDILHENGEARARFAGVGRKSLVVPVGTTPIMNAGKKRIVVLSPMGEGDALGWVRLQYGSRDIELLLKDIFRHTAVASLLGIFIGLAALLVVLRPISRAIREIAAFAQNLNERKGETMPVLTGVSEIEDLSLSLNEASLKLFFAEQALMRSSASVEEHAQRLTKELAERRLAEEKLSRFAHELKESHDDLRARS